MSLSGDTAAGSRRDHQLPGYPAGSPVIYTSINTAAGSRRDHYLYPSAGSPVNAQLVTKSVTKLVFVCVPILFCVSHKELPSGARNVT